jgi:hypothetical protein
MGPRDRWIFLALFTGFSTVLILVTVLIAQLETYVPGRNSHTAPPTPEDETDQQINDECDAA